LLPEERRDLVEGDQVHPVVQIHVTCARNNKKFFGLTGKPVGILTALILIMAFDCPEAEFLKRKLEYMNKLTPWSRKYLGTSFSEEALVELNELARTI
jgi:hypothetical protein